MGDHDRSRREFIGGTAAAGLMAVAGTAADVISLPARALFGGPYGY